MGGSDRARPNTLAGRLVLWHAVAVVGVLLVLGVVVDRMLEGYFVDQLTGSLISDARTIQETLPARGDLEPEVERLGRNVGIRITIIRADGVVLADSQHDPATMQNHRNRPEVRQALTGRIGESSRESATIGIPFRYVALPPRDGRIVRVALPLTTVHARVRTVRLILALGFGAAALAGLVALAVIAGGLSRPLRRITGAVERMGEAGPEVPLPEGGTKEVALLAVTVNRMRGEVAARVAAIEEERTARDAILSSLDEGVVLFDAQGMPIYRNEQSEQLLGYRVESTARLAPGALQQLVAAAAREGRSQTAEVTSGAERRMLLASATPLAGAGRVLLVLRDVTKARTIDAVRRDFVANASHELKTPAASIRALAETIASAASDDPQAIRQFAEQLEREAVRLSAVVSDLLDLSRLEGELADSTVVRLDQIVSHEADRITHRAEEAGLAVSVGSDGEITVEGSPRELSLLVRNLLENAVQYTKPGGRVEVHVSEEDGAAVLTVSDTGIGIPTKDQGRIFERFYRVDRGRSRETGGTGLGLSIVKHVAENHGGTVTVKSELGQGSTFTVRIPRTAKNRGA